MGRADQGERGAGRLTRATNGGVADERSVRESRLRLMTTTTPGNIRRRSIAAVDLGKFHPTTFVRLTSGRGRLGV
ncbi:MAG TPA: hypothetical protein VGJ20_29835 [Xanthobacteraceae bacterium]